MSFSNRMSDFGLLWLRVAMGCGIAYHGYGKIFEGHMDKFIQGVSQLGFSNPEIFAWAAALSEFIGGILVAVGFMTRPAAFMIFVTMFVAVFLKHTDDPFSKKELAMAYLVMAATLVLTGPGGFSLMGGSGSSSTKAAK